MSEMDLSPIWQSEPIVNLVIAVHPRVRPAAREQLQRRMLDWHRTDSGRELLDHLSWPGMVAAKEGDFDSVRQVAARLRAYASG
jgi:ABC-type phosphate/phosphonate transport system substrate-binding protein